MEIYYIIMCRSLTYAQRAARVLERAGVFASVVKPPQGVTTAEGCSYGVKVAARHGTRALSLVKGAGVRTGKVFALYDDGTATEAEL